MTPRHNLNGPESVLVTLISHDSSQFLQKLVNVLINRMHLGKLHEHHVKVQQKYW